MRIPRGVLIGAGMAPVAVIFVLLVWAVTRDDTNPGGLSVFDATGEAQVVNAQARQFTLRLFDGTQVTAQSLRGKVVVLDFWASWCPPCRREAPALEAVWQQYRDRGVQFVGVDIWDKDDRAQQFIRDFQISYPVGVDPRGALAVDYGVTGIPEKYFLNREGRVVRKFVGPMDRERLTRVLEELLGTT